jgi:hypothetical protein
MRQQNAMVFINQTMMPHEVLAAGEKEYSIRFWLRRERRPYVHRCKRQ